MNSHTIAQYYQAHRDELVGFVAARLEDEDEAQDLVQNLFLRLLCGHRPITELTLPSLVYTMARHLIADYYRRRRLWNEFEHYIKGRGAADDSMESVFSAQEIVRQMENGLARLPESCREVYRLHIYGGMKVSEISDRLGENYRSVEHRLGVARKAIRQQLAACV